MVDLSIVTLVYQEISPIHTVPMFRCFDHTPGMDIQDSNSHKQRSAEGHPQPSRLGFKYPINLPENVSIFCFFLGLKWCKCSQFRNISDVLPTWLIYSYDHGYKPIPKRGPPKKKTGPASSSGTGDRRVPRPNQESLPAVGSPWKNRRISAVFSRRPSKSVEFFFLRMVNPPQKKAIHWTKQICRVQSRKKNTRCGVHPCPSFVARKALQRGFLAHDSQLGGLWWTMVDSLGSPGRGSMGMPLPSAGASYPCLESLDPHEAPLESCRLWHPDKSWRSNLEPKFGDDLWSKISSKKKTARQCWFHREFQGVYVPVFARPLAALAALAFCFTSWDWPTRPATSAQSPRKPTGCFPLRSIVT